MTYKPSTRPEAEQQFADFVWSAEELSPGDADHAVAGGGELGVFQAVFLECPAVEVVLAAVDLDDEALVWPEGVDLVAHDRGVGYWLGERVVCAEAAEGQLEVGAQQGLGI